jgi:peptide deformylase
MAVLPIIITGDPVLHTPAGVVTTFDSSLKILIEDMFETMKEAPGVGLAAPQIGVSQRIFVYDWIDDDDTRWRGVAINPELWHSPTPLREPDEDDEEGCLSIPGERFGLVRAEQVILRAVDLEEKPFEIEASGWLARIFQHEYDHLDGVLYADRLREPDAKAAAKAIRKQGWGQPGNSWLPTEEQLDA